jgi:hypothetical protein
MDLLETYNKLVENIENLKKEATAQAKLALSAMATEYYSRYSDLVYAITWTQYTPYFMDGDQCVFSVGTVDVLMKHLSDGDYEEYTDEYAFDESYFDKQALKLRIEERKKYDADPLEWSRKKVAEYKKLYSWHKDMKDDYFVRYPSEGSTVESLQAMLQFADNLDENFVKDTTNLISAISSIDEDTMQILFGEGVRVVIRHNGTSVETLIEEYEHD